METLSQTLTLNEKLKLFAYKTIEKDGKAGKKTLEMAYKAAKAKYDGMTKEMKLQTMNEIDQAIDRVMDGPIQN